MIRGTTPTHIFDTDISLVEAEVIYVTYKQGKVILEKTKDDIRATENQLQVDLTQEETLMFATYREAEVQIRAKFADGTAVASNVSQIIVAPIIKEGVI